MDAGTHQFVDGALDRGHVGRQHGNPFAVADLGQFFGEARWVRGVDAVSDLGDVRMPEVAGCLCDLSFDQFQEGRTVCRQDIGEAGVGAAPRAPRLLRRAQLLDHLQHPLHGLGVDAGTVVQHPVDRGRARPRRCGRWHPAMVGVALDDAAVMSCWMSSSLLTSINKSIRVLEHATALASIRLVRPVNVFEGRAT